MKIKHLGFLLIPLIMSGCEQFQGSPHVKEIPWALTGQWLKLDTHTHTRFSDGNLSVDELVNLTELQGCDAIAITDHSDLGLKSVTPEYFEAIRMSRLLNPNLIVIGGFEWNIPPYNGREHVTVLLAPELEASVGPSFKEQFEKDEANSADALAWLSGQLSSEQDAVLFYNHPSRKDDDVTENLDDYINWTQTSTLFAGFEGGPGHQKYESIGAYKYKFSTEDRWDPVVAEIGGVWDTLLDQGHDVWAALATSDFHNKQGDYLPCEFARIHIQVPEKTPRGVLQALRAGSFWADHGQVLDQLSLLISAENLDLPVTAGEIIRLDSDSSLQISVAITRGKGAIDSPLMIELISNSRSGKPEIIDRKQLPPGTSTAAWTLTDLQKGSDNSSAYFRIRVRKVLDQQPDLLAYSNPIRVHLN